MTTQSVRKVKTRKNKVEQNNLKNHISIRIGDTEKIKKKSTKKRRSNKQNKPIKDKEIVSDVRNVPLIIQQPSYYNPPSQDSDFVKNMKLLLSSTMSRPALQNLPNPQRNDPNLLKRLKDVEDFITSSKDKEIMLSSVRKPPNNVRNTPEIYDNFNADNDEIINSPNRNLLFDDEEKETEGVPININLWNERDESMDEKKENSKSKKIITCRRCGQIGHKSNNPIFHSDYNGWKANNNVTPYKDEIEDVDLSGIETESLSQTIKKGVKKIFNKFKK